MCCLVVEEVAESKGLDSIKFLMDQTTHMKIIRLRLFEI
jgi:hypothetical protein